MSNKPNTRRSGRAPAGATRKGVPPRPSRSTNGPSRGVVLGIVAAVVAVLAIVALVVSGLGDDSADVGPQTRPVQISGSALPELVPGATDPAVGTRAPTVTGSSFDGSTVTIANDGTPKLVFFLAHWCPHCRREVPVIVDWLQDNGMPDGVELYGVATATSSDRPNYPPSEWLEKEEWPVTTLADDDRSSVAAAFGLSAYPFFVAIDANGDVVARTSGELTIPQLEALVDAARGPEAGPSSD